MSISEFRIFFLSMVVSLPMLLIAANPSRAQTAGADSEVGVIVELALPGTPFRPEGSLRSRATVTGQRARIASAKADLLGRVRGLRARAYAEWKTLPYVALRVDPKTLSDLRASSGVASIHEDELFRPTLASAAAHVGADRTFSGGHDGSGQTVVIFDTGIDADHPFFGDRVVDEACFSGALSGTSLCPNSERRQFGPGSADALTPECQPGGIPICAHGSHVAGIAAGRDPGGSAGTGYNGIAPAANVIAIQVFTRFGFELGAHTSDLLSALEYVNDVLRPRWDIAAINMSLGGGRSSGPCDSHPLKVAIDNLRSNEIATVIASGNDGWTSSLSRPGCISSAVTVASADDPSDRVTSFSNMNEVVDLLAPGSDVDSSVPDDDFASFSGTSMASPMVTGAFAVLKGLNPSLGVTEIEELLETTGVAATDDRPSHPPGSARGLVKPRLDLNAALEEVAVLNPYFFYRVAEDPAARMQPFGAITLQDEFGIRRWNVIRPSALGLPADQNSQGILDRATHLTEFKIRPVDGLRNFARIQDVRIVNECTDLFLQVRRPSTLLVPSSMSLAGPAPSVNGKGQHYLCYEAKVEKARSDGSLASGFPKGIQVDVADEFQTRRYDLKAVTKLCNPVRTSGEPFYLKGPNAGKPLPITPAEVRDRNDNLVCYRAEPAKRSIAQDGCGPAQPRLVGKIDPPQAKHELVEGIHVKNQFGEQQLRSRGEVELCLRSVANPECSDGHVDAFLGEECDDGNMADGDGCSSACRADFCGDGIAQPGIGEQCDGSDDSMCPQGCRSDCRCPLEACLAATEIPPEGGTFFGTTSGPDTVTSSCIADTGPEKVFAWTPAQSGVATIDTCGSSYDTVLYVREAICEDPSRQLACNDDFCGTGSSVFPEVRAGTTYFIFVDGFGDDSGSFRLDVKPPLYGSPSRAFLGEVPGLLE